MKEKVTKILIVSSLCLSFVVNSILITISYTRRSADDIQKIESSRNKEEIACLSGNGKWVSGGGPFYCQPK